MVVLFLAYMTVLFPQWFDFSREVYELVGYATLFGLVLFMVAWRLMTQPDPSGLGEDRLFLFMAFIPAMAGFGRGFRSGTAVACFGGILALLWLIFGAMYLLLVEKMGKRFKEQSSAARLSWAAIEFSRPAPPA